MYIHEDMEQFTMTADEIYALKKEMKHKDKIIDDLIESMGKMADKYKRLLFEKDSKIEELNDELRLTRSENVLLNGLVHEYTNEVEQVAIDQSVCDYCQESATLRKYDGIHFCDKCYLHEKD